MYNLLGKSIRGRFGFPSGVITTNSDVAKWMFRHVPQFGFYQGKSTTITVRTSWPNPRRTRCGTPWVIRTPGWTPRWRPSGN
jgi:hypothetical protein